MEDQLDATQKGELQQLLENYPEVVRDLCPHGKMNWRKTSGTRKGAIPCNNPCGSTFSGFKTIWLHFHHPYIWQHFDASTTNASYNIQQAALILTAQATTLQPEV